MLAVIDALRDELAEVGPDGVVAGARLGLKLSDGRADELTERIEELILEYADKPDDEDGAATGST